MRECVCVSACEREVERERKRERVRGKKRVLPTSIYGLINALFHSIVSRVRETEWAPIRRGTHTHTLTHI